MVISDSRAITTDLAFPYSSVSVTSKPAIELLLPFLLLLLLLLLSWLLGDSGDVGDSLVDDSAVVIGATRDGGGGIVSELVDLFRWLGTTIVESDTTTGSLGTINAGSDMVSDAFASLATICLINSFVDGSKPHTSHIRPPLF
jgi:hypothetical protein